MKDTVILIPSYEPDDQLVPLVNSLLKLEYKVIVINDGSSEKYDEIFNQVKDLENVTYLKHKVNKGKGAALKHGFSYLTFDDLDCKYVITCDGDGQHAISDIVKVDEKMHKVNEITFGVREFGPGTPRHSKTGNNMSRFCRTLITKHYIQDDQCGLRGFPFKYLDGLISTPGGRYEYEMNIVCNLQMKRYPFYEVPIQTVYFNNNKGTHFHRGKDTFRIQRVIWTNSLYSIINFMLTIGFFFVTQYFNHIPHLENWNSYYSLQVCCLFSFLVEFALTSLLIPSKRTDRRLFVQGIFTVVRWIFVFGWFTLFNEVLGLRDYPLVNICISIFLSTFVNFFFAYIIHKFKYMKIKREYR